MKAYSREAPEAEALTKVTQVASRLLPKPLSHEDRGSSWFCPWKSSDFCKERYKQHVHGPTPEYIRRPRTVNWHQKGNEPVIVRLLPEDMRWVEELGAPTDPPPSQELYLREVGQAWRSLDSAPRKAE